jgi:ABC-2 type transport system ATP-binding protein
MSVGSGRSIDPPAGTLVAHDLGGATTGVAGRHGRKRPLPVGGSWEDTEATVPDVLTQPSEVGSGTRQPLAIEVVDIVRHFGSIRALDGVSIRVRPGEIHALLGPNGAGKTTLIRSLTGLVQPSSGTVRLLGVSSDELGYRQYRRMFGLVPSGDRSFYLRISGLENLIFFGRLYGLRKPVAVPRAWECIRAVGLEEAAKRRVGVYSHGMQKRLSVARGLLAKPVVLLIDEATHDLDPEGARRVQELVVDAARQGSAVVWATQRLDEIRGFADRVTVLDRGKVRFVGTVPELMAISVARRYVLHIDDGTSDSVALVASANRVLSSMATVTMTGATEAGHCTLDLSEEAILGDAISLLTAAGIKVLACREERSGIENAFLYLTRKGSG